MTYLSCGLWFGLLDLHWPFFIFLRSLISPVVYINVISEQYFVPNNFQTRFTILVHCEAEDEHTLVDIMYGPHFLTKLLEVEVYSNLYSGYHKCWAKTLAKLAWGQFEAKVFMIVKWTIPHLKAMNVSVHFHYRPWQDIVRLLEI